VRSDPLRAARPLAAATLAASWALLSVGCDALVGLDPTILEINPTPKDAAAKDAVSAPLPRMDASMDAAPEASPDAAPCSRCPSGCVDTTSDGDNCGTCGHSCLGAACRGGACAAVLLATGSPADLAVDPANVYWTDGTNGNVERCPIAGCPDGGEMLFSGFGDAGGSVAGIEVQDTRLLFAESALMTGEVYACPTDGCGSSPAPLARETGGHVGAVAADAKNVYWTSTVDQSVHACPIEGCADGGPAVLAAGSVDSSDPWRLVVRGGRFYFAFSPFFGSMGGVGGCSLAGCTCSSGACVLPSAAGSPPAVTAIAAGTSGVCWTSESTNVVIANPIGTNSPAAASVLATATAPGKVAIDPDDNVYFTTGQPEAIYRCAAGGCNGKPTLAASGLGSLGDIAVDAKRIYAVVGTQTNQTSFLTNGVLTSQLAAPVGTAVVWVAK
jgi:hypothetical protein